MTKKEALKWIEDIKEISPFTRNFISWLHDKHGGIIANKEEHEKINQITVFAHIHGMNPFDK